MMASFHRILIASLCMLYILQESQHHHPLIRGPTGKEKEDKPFLLFDCFGFTTAPVSFFVGLVAVFVDLLVLDFRLGGGGGSGAGLITGEARKTEGDGIVIVSILITSLGDTLTLVRCDRARRT